MLGLSRVAVGKRFNINTLIKIEWWRLLSPNASGIQIRRRKVCIRFLLSYSIQTPVDCRLENR